MSDENMPLKESKSFQDVADQKRTSIVGEFFYFLNQTKKWWLAPILIVLACVALLVIASSTGAAPFIYTLF